MPDQIKMRLNCPICYLKFNQKRYNHNASGCFHKKTKIACNFCGEEHKITECTKFMTHLQGQRQEMNSRTHGVRADYRHTADGHYPCDRGTDDYYPHDRETGVYHPRDRGIGDYYPCDRGSGDYYPHDRGTGVYHPRDKGANDYYPRDRGSGDYFPCDRETDYKYPRYRGTGVYYPHIRGADNYYPRYGGADKYANDRAEEVYYPQDYNPPPSCMRGWESFPTQPRWREAPPSRDRSPRGRTSSHTYSQREYRRSRSREKQTSETVPVENRDTTDNEGQIDDLFKNILNGD